MVIKFGGGVDSTGLICAMLQRGQRADAVIFGDTGGERPHTYENVAAVDRLIQAHGWPAIVTVYATRKGERITLEEHSLRTKKMPSVSYGRKSCSQRFKAEPAEKWIKAWAPARETWAAGGKVRMAIGYNVSELRRYTSAPAADNRYTYEYPLVRMGWGRDECLEAAARFGLNPKKSACFYCGSARQPEVIRLYNEDRALFNRGLAMERGARPFRGAIQGLGKNFAWEDIAYALEHQAALDFGASATSEEYECECHEGGTDPDEEDDG